MHLLRSILGLSRPPNPLPAPPRLNHESVAQPSRVPLTPRYDADPAVALHAQSVALRMLNDTKTQRTQVKAGMPGAEAFRYDNDASFPGITLNLYRIPGVPHSWKVTWPPGNGKRREVILSGVVAIPLDGAEFEQGEKVRGAK